MRRCYFYLSIITIIIIIYYYIVLLWINCNVYIIVYLYYILQKWLILIIAKNCKSQWVVYCLRIYLMWRTSTVMARNLTKCRVFIVKVSPSRWIWSWILTPGSIPWTMVKNFDWFWHRWGISVNNDINFWCDLKLQIF